VTFAVDYPKTATSIFASRAVFAVKFAVEVPNADPGSIFESRAICSVWFAVYPPSTIAINPFDSRAVFAVTFAIDIPKTVAVVMYFYLIFFHAFVLLFVDYVYIIAHYTQMSSLWVKIKL
jgi:hypothetical protein